MSRFTCYRGCAPDFCRTSRQTKTAAMNRLLLCLLATSTTVLAAAQFTDDFESYALGAYLGQTSSDWTTWSGNTGGSEDVQITDTDAHSGTQSIYFISGDPNGGPQDVVLPFGGAYETGSLLFETWIKVEPNKSAYLNFQSEVTTGVTWALECHMNDLGNVIVVSDTAVVINGSYTPDTWFKMTWDVNLDSNVWELLIDGNSLGSFANNNNKIASLDLFPVNSQGTNDSSGYWVDDVSFTYTAPPPPVGIEGPAGLLVDVSPNPALESVLLTFSHDTHALVTITDLNGRLLNSFSTEGKGSLRLPVSGLSSGMYLLHVQAGEEQSTSRLVVGRY